MQTGDQWSRLGGFLFEVVLRRGVRTHSHPRMHTQTHIHKIHVFSVESLCHLYDSTSTKITPNQSLFLPPF